MSKMNNNSRKNINKNTSKANKASKKNFKIESLEPRLLMAAAVDWDKINNSFVNDYFVDNASLTPSAVSLYAA
ncbi:MAG: LEPR-XLL domain-containing protein [Fibrobacter sp.]|nr:LEPR-XLL domain-containing protein [Fibrobacter sp.]